jgi:hypothetical protein
MSWTDDEREAACFALEAYWPGEFDESMRVAYLGQLERYAPADVLRVLNRLLHRPDQKFRPSVHEIVCALRGDERPASFPEAWSLIEQAVIRFGCSIYSPRFAEQHRAAIAWLAERDRDTAGWAARRGLFQLEGSLGREEVGDPEYGGAVRHRLGLEHGDWIAECDQRQLAGGQRVPDSMLICRKAESSGGMDELVESLRPAAQLPAGGDDGDRS